MTTENDVTQKDESTSQNDEATKQKDSSSNADLDKLVQERVAAELRDIKAKLDKAYAIRDEALQKAAKYEQEQKEAEIARLKEEGKHKEAYEKQLAEERAQRQALEQRNIELTRDIDVRSALSGLNFKNEKAMQVAFTQVVAELVRNDKNEWVHKSGIPIKDFIKAFSENSENEFLFRTKASSGTGSTNVGSKTVVTETKKSLFELPQDEVLKLAEEGKLSR